MSSLTIGKFPKCGREFRVARASRLLAIASRDRELSLPPHLLHEARFGEMPKPARGARALPGLIFARCSGGKT